MIKDSVVEWANDWGREMGIYGISTERIPAGQHDDLDAFRHAFCHAYVMAWLSVTSRGKDVSDWIGLIMEMPGLFSSQSTSRCAKAMDYHNNKVGQELAPTREEMWSVLRYGEDPTPFIAKRIADAVKRGDTINSFDDPRMPKKCRLQAKIKGDEYIWRTKNDDKVRWDHAVREGKRFSIKNPPPDGPPGANYNCRCVAVPVSEENE